MKKYDRICTVTSMKHVHIKWKSVTAVTVMVLTFVILYYRLYPGQTCSSFKDPRLFKEYEQLDVYCNYPYQPVSGQESDVPPLDSDLKLLSVHIIIRHGDRSPLHSLPHVSNQPLGCRYDPQIRSDYLNLSEFTSRMKLRGERKSGSVYGGFKLYPNDVSCDVGSLTPSGVMQHILNGAFMRSVYISKHHLLKSGDTAAASEQIMVRGTTYSRTFQSAVAFMYGFEPAIDMANFQSIEMADNNTLCTAHTGHSCSCPSVAARHLDSFSAAFGQHSSSIKKLPATHRIATRLGAAVTELPRLSHIFDVAMTHYCHRLMPGCFDTSFAREVFDVINEAGRLASVDRQYQRLARLKSQPLLYEIVQRMKRQAGIIDSHTSTSISPVFVLYSGHDSTVEPLASAIGISSGLWPKYASRLVFELFGSGAHSHPNTDAYIRVLYDGRDVTKHVIFCKGRMTGTDNKFCSIKHFAEFVEEAEFNGSPTKTGYADACSKEVNIT